MSRDAPNLILASSSIGRRRLLQRLQLDFQCIAPDIDESPEASEDGQALACRLARAKAARVAGIHPEAIVIGSDQVAEVDGRILGKPGTRARAREQLRLQSGRRVVFHTGLCVCAPTLSAPRVTRTPITTHFRELSAEEIRHYVDAEDVTGTAGSLKSEGLGITLVEAIESRDPTALVGLPLISLRQLLFEAGVVLPGDS